VTRFLSWVVLLVGAPLVIGFLSWFATPIAAWFAAMALLALSILIGGWLVTGYLWGAFIDEWNKISLSRFQTILWTILLLGAFSVAAIQNVRFDRVDDGFDPLSIAIPEELWIVLGISATSLVGSPLIKSIKQTRPPNPDEATTTLRRAGVLSSNEDAARRPTDPLVLENAAGAVVAKGQIAVKPSPANASWDDMFKGDETSNAANLDLGKIQMFYFTLILLLAYGVSLGRLLDRSTPYTDFPALNEGMVALLGISHAAYLTNKAVPRT